MLGPVVDTIRRRSQYYKDKIYVKLNNLFQSSRFLMLIEIILWEITFKYSRKEFLYSTGLNHVKGNISILILNLLYLMDLTIHSCK
jgi:hypothetical protein